MFSKILSSMVLVLAVSSQVSAHNIFTPALGVTGTAVRGDVQQPSTAKPCGNIDVASTIDTSTPVVANAAGTFTVSSTDFNAGNDGSTAVSSSSIDPTGAGKFSGEVTIVKNGNADPTAVETDTITATLPAGTTCTAGTAKNLCIVSLKTAAGFGNCVLVQQAAASGAAADTTGADTSAADAADTTTSAAAAAATTAAATTAAATTGTTGTTSTTSTAAEKAAKKKAKAAKKKAKAAAAKGGAAAKAGAAAASAKAETNVAVTEPCDDDKASKTARNVGGSRAARAVLSGVMNIEEWA